MTKPAAVTAKAERRAPPDDASNDGAEVGGTSLKASVKLAVDTCAAARAADDQRRDRKGAVVTHAGHGSSRQNPAALIAAQQAQVAQLARRLLGWSPDVADVVQDVFVAALEQWPRFRGEAAVGTWLYRITVNECRRWRRRKRLRVVRALDFVTGQAREAGQSPDAAAADEVARRVQAAVRALPQKYREVVVLRYLEELSVDEIGGILGIKRNAVETRLSRARRRLGEHLADLAKE